MDTSVFDEQEVCYGIASRLPGILYRCLCDDQRTVEFISGNYIRLTGYKKIERLSDIIHPSHRQRVLEEMKKSGSEEPAGIEYLILTANGDEKWVLDHVAEVHDPVTGKCIAREGMLIDISQRKKKEGYFKLYPFLIDQTHDPIYVVDPETAKFLAVNTQACTMLGYTNEELVSKHVYDIQLALPDIRAWRRHVADVRQNGYFKLQGAQIRKDKSVLPVEIIVRQVKDNGKEYFVAVARDITERLETQKLLEKSNERFNLLSKASQDAIYDWNLMDNTIWWSDGFENLVGPEISKRNFGFVQWCDHVHPDDRERVLNSLNEAFFNKDSNWVGEYRFRDENGNYRYIYDRGHVIYNDKVMQRLVGSMQDITERKMHEKRLKQRLVYEHLVNELSSKFINCQAEGVDDLINEALRAIGEFTKVDRSYLFLISEDGRTVSNTHEWFREGVNPQMSDWQNVEFGSLDWWVEAFSEFKALNVPRVADLPEEALAYKHLIEKSKVKSFILMPLLTRGKLKGVLGFDSVLAERTWDDDDIAMLNIISAVLTNAIVKRNHERALMDNKHYLSQIIDASPVAIFVKDLEGKYVISNKTFAGFFDSTPEQMQGKSDIDLGLPPEVVNEVHRKDMMVFERQEPFLAYEMKLPHTQSGLMHTIEIIKVPVKRGSSMQVLGIGMDVTARKQVEEKLQKEKEFSENLINTANVMVIGLDLEGKVLIFNNEAEKITGYDAKEVIGTSFFAKIVPRDKFNYVQDSFERFVGTNSISTNDESPILSKNGEERFISWRNMPMKNGDEVIGSISFGIDITEKRIAEQKFKEQYVELEKINKELDRFVYSASHDLKAPLSSILGLVNVARMEELSKSQAQYLDMIEKNITKLNGFILDIINYSRNSRTDLVKARVNVEELIKGTIEDLQYMNGLDKIQVRHEVIEECPFYSDAARLKVILNNLLSNAINYHIIFRDSPYIKILVTVKRDQLELQVEDNGQGIKGEHLPKIFDMFYRGSDNSKGSGLGLYIVKEIVNKMHGSISVESAPLKGTKFIVTLSNMYAGE